MHSSIRNCIQSYLKLNLLKIRSTTKKAAQEQAIVHQCFVWGYMQPYNWPIHSIQLLSWDLPACDACLSHNQTRAHSTGEHPHTARNISSWMWQDPSLSRSRWWSAWKRALEELEGFLRKAQCAVGLSSAHLQTVMDDPVKECPLMVRLKRYAVLFLP